MIRRFGGKYCIQLECQLFWVGAEVIRSNYRPLYKKMIEALPRYTSTKRRNI